MKNPIHKRIMHPSIFGSQSGKIVSKIKPMLVDKRVIIKDIISKTNFDLIEILIFRIP